MKVGLLVLWLLVLPSLGFAAGWVLEPAVITPGGVTRLTWKGEQDARLAVRFRGETIRLTPSVSGPTTLLGIDLEAAEGAYPVEATVIDGKGRKVHFGLHLRVERPPRKARPAERLSLPKDYVTPRQPEQLERIRREREMLKILYGGRSEHMSWQSFQRPVTTSVSSVFGRGRVMNGKTPSLHAGVDFSGVAGTPVAAAAAGQVAFAGDLYFTGMTVILDHGDGLFTLYAHLQRLLCREGEEVMAGTTVGELGSTGRATGPHLHWGAKLRGARIDPLALVRLTAGKSVDSSRVD